MNLRRDAITIFLIAALLPNDTVFGLIPSTCRTQTGWGITQTKPHFLETRLAVSTSPAAAENEVEGDIDDDDVEDEEYDYEELLSKKEKWIQDLERLAHASSEDRNAVAQAQGIFDEMFDAYVTTEESAMWPTDNIYNLLIETHAYSKAEDGGDEAENILSRMEDDSVEFIARPNLETYLKVMDAWAMRKNPEKAQAILERLEKRYSETDDESLKPAVEAYNKLIKAHGMVGDVEKAESILRDLLENDAELKANYKSWIHTMKAYAPLKDGTEKVQSLFDEMLKAYRMGEEEYKPTTEAYNVLIRSIGQKPDGAAKAEAMLFELIEQFRGVW
jgi:pentatricopeptide repeat protein